MVSYYLNLHSNRQFINWGFHIKHRTTKKKRNEGNTLQLNTTEIIGSWSQQEVKINVSGIFFIIF